MTENKMTTQRVLWGLLGKRMLIGACIGFIIISFFVFGVDNPDPAWEEYWQVRPLIVTPMAGAAAGMFYHFMDDLRYQGGGMKILANILSVIVYLVALWLGTVLGLAGTMWN